MLNIEEIYNWKESIITGQLSNRISEMKTWIYVSYVTSLLKANTFIWITNTSRCVLL